MTRQHDRGAEPNQPSSPRITPRSRRRSLPYMAIVLMGILVFGAVAVALLNRDDDESPGPSNAIPATAAATQESTPLPPVEPTQEVALQQQLTAWFLTVAGVDSVSSLDVDVPADEPPLVYAEIAVSPGYNDSRIPETLIAHLKELLNTSQFSDVVVIIDDGAHMTEYTLDPASMVWNDNLLSGPSEPDDG